MALEEAGHSSQIQIFQFWCGQHWNAGSESPCSGLVRCPLCCHNLHTADNNPHACGCIRTPRSSQSPCCSQCLPAPHHNQKQHYNFSPAELLGKGGNSTSTSTASYPEEGVHSMYTGAAVLCPLCPAQGLSKCPAPCETATRSGNTSLPPHTAHLQILLLLDVCLLEIFPRGVYKKCIFALW